MVFGVPGEVVVQLVVLEFRQELVLTQLLHMEDLSVLEIQKNIVSHDHVLVMNLFSSIRCLHYSINVPIYFITDRYVSESNVLFYSFAAFDEEQTPFSHPPRPLLFCGHPVRRLN